VIFCKKKIRKINTIVYLNLNPS